MISNIHDFIERSRSEIAKHFNICIWFDEETKHFKTIEAMHVIAIVETENNSGFYAYFIIITESRVLYETNYFKESGKFVIKGYTEEYRKEI